MTYRVLPLPIQSRKYILTYPTLLLGSDARVWLRGANYTYFLSHQEDLSGTRDVTLKWTFEADILNPLSYCVPPFCNTSLPVSAVILTPLYNR